MSNSRHLREVFIFISYLKETATEVHQMLSSTYGETALSQRTCCQLIQRFKSGDFKVEDRHGGGKEKIFEDTELETLLAGVSCQTQEELKESLGVTQQDISKYLKVMEVIQKQQNCVRRKMSLLR